MKKTLLIMVLLFAVVAYMSAQASKVKKDPAGKWQFEAPEAPEGFTTGLVEVALAENKYSASMSFTGSDYKLPAEEVKFENDTLSFSIYVEAESVTITLKMEEKDKMSGTASYSGGVIPLTVTREKKKE